MKTSLVPINVFKLTIHGTKDNRPYQASKKVQTAQQAADFYVKIKGTEWWFSRGSKCNIMPNNPQGLRDRYERWRLRDFKLHRRVLRIFQKVLP